MTHQQKQCMLAYLGYIRPAESDGIWGPESAHATECLQEDLGLEADGIWGPATDGAVRKLIGSGEDIPKRKNTTGTWWDEIEYFTREEFRCQCGMKHVPYCDGYPAEPTERLVRIADELRRRLGVPVTIISGLRCVRHNADCGGVSNSQHMYGEAADVYAAGISPALVEATLDAIGGVRYHYQIQGSSNVHFDIPMGER